MMKLKEPKVFSLEEARSTLPFVKKIVADVVRTHNELAKIDEEIKLTTNLEERRHRIYQKDQLKQQLEEYQQELDLVGCHLKNPSSGIIGYYWDAGDGLELCWKYGEDDICYWQEIGHNQLLPLSQKTPSS